MNRRGFLGALTTAMVGTAATAVPGSEASIPARSHEVVLGRRVRHPAHLEWLLPHDFSLDDVQKCVDKVAAMDRRLEIVSAEFGSADMRDRCVELLRQEAGGRHNPAATPLPLYVNERLGSRGLRFEVERRKA